MNRSKPPRRIRLRSRTPRLWSGLPAALLLLVVFGGSAEAGALLSTGPAPAVAGHDHAGHGPDAGTTSAASGHDMSTMSEEDMSGHDMSGHDMAGHDAGGHGTSGHDAGGPGAAGHDATGHGSGDPSRPRPVAPVLGTFGALNAAILLGALGWRRRLDHLRQTAPTTRSASSSSPWRSR